MLSRRNSPIQLSRSTGRFRRKSHDGVTERRNLALPNPPRSPVATLVRHGALRRSAIPRPSLYDHLHPTDAGESPLEMVVERRVVWAHDDEHFGIRKRLRWKEFKEPFLVIGADAVCRRGVIERLALT